MPKRTVQQDGGEWLGKWHTTRVRNLLKLSGDPPKNLCIEELKLTIGCRYAQWLLANERIKRYLAKHHPSQLRQLNAVICDLANAIESRLPTHDLSARQFTKPRIY